MTKQEEFWKLAQEMLAEKDFSRIKELEELNEQHKKINGELRQENKELQENFEKAQEDYWKVSDIELELFARIDKAIEYIEEKSKSNIRNIVIITLAEVEELLKILKY